MREEFRQFILAESWAAIIRSLDIEGNWEFDMAELFGSGCYGEPHWQPDSDELLHLSTYQRNVAKGIIRGFTSIREAQEFTAKRLLETVRTLTE